jgi:hypothetical protein
MNLERQFAGGGDDQRQRLAGALEAFGLAEQGGGEREAIGDGLARAGLGRDEFVAGGQLGLQNGGLDRGRLVIAALGEGANETGMRKGKWHGGRTNDLGFPTP